MVGRAVPSGAKAPSFVGVLTDGLKPVPFKAEDPGAKAPSFAGVLTDGLKPVPFKAEEPRAEAPSFVMGCDGRAEAVPLTSSVDWLMAG